MSGALKTISCFQCGKASEFTLPVGRRDECPHCHADIHVCKNCLYYDPKAYHECREPVSEYVSEKDRANYCDHFNPGSHGAKVSASSRDELRAKAEALFAGLNKKQS